RGIELLDAASLRTRHLLPSSGWPHDMAWSPDGKRLAISWGDHVALHDAEGKRVNPTEGHEGAIRSLALSSDGTLAASGDQAGGVRLWELATGRLLRSMRTGDSIQALAFSPDGRRLAAGASAYQAEGEVRVWNVADGKERLRFPAHLSGATHLAFTSDGRRLVTSGRDDRVRWWDARTGARLSQVRHLPEPRLLGLIGDEALIHGSDGRTERVGPDGAARTLLVPVAGSDVWHRPAALLPDGRVALHRTDGVVLLSPRNGTRVGSSVFKATDLKLWHAWAISPDARLLVLHEGGVPRLRGLREGRDLLALAPKGRDPTCAAFTRDGSRLVVAWDDTTLAVYDPRVLHARGMLGGWLADHAGTRLLIEGRREGMGLLSARLREAIRIEAAARALAPRLADDAFAVREEAQARIRGWGAPAARVLEEVRRSAEIETRMRCKRLLEALPEEDRAHWSGPRLREALAFLRERRWPGAEAMLRELAATESFVGTEARAALEGKP
ncbi:MAG: hypothetical protein K2W96_05745, partial [Gemmataceae bacterium]|nr:hypothetical protein [Gemmataceae bacterium]